ncbi:PucR family transcriptional regulator ligand-binding domain-containing protein [Microbacterium sp. ISL-108]|nr:PucR family transcriptional regulator ligand-binding domain-containing protein [Microbacterium sp. ISL-108]RKN64865.1 PucR family transcriptional regulator [Microbacterium sp. CGR2]
MADVLRMPQVRAGRPLVVVGGAALNAGVRWAHVSDSADVARLLDGGELLLSTGSAWPAAPEDQRVFARGLHAVGVAGVILELGSAHLRIPEAFIEACNDVGIALIALQDEVKFVAVTEAVHRALIAAQTDALRERQHLHELFTGLSLRGAPADIVVAETARMLDAPVVLENLAREVIAAEGMRMRVADTLARWTESPDSGVERVPVQARGVSWGTLVAFEGPAHPAGRRTVLEQAAVALALGCLAEGGDAEWRLLAHRTIIEDLLGVRFASTRDITARLAAGGFPVDGRRCHGMVVRGSGPVAAANARAQGIDCAVVAAQIDGVEVVLLSLPATAALTDQTVANIVGPDGLIFLGPEADGILELLASLRAARDLAASQPGDAGPRVRRVDDRPLGRLITALRDDHRLHEHSERMLAPLIRHDRERGGDLLDVLTALVAHPGNRSAAAVASHLSRSVFYQRLALIGDLLDVDLDDGEVLAALHLALRAREGSAQRVPQL